MSYCDISVINNCFMVAVKRKGGTFLNDEIADRRSSGRLFFYKITRPEQAQIYSLNA
jgi:hypothetical protein